MIQFCSTHNLCLDLLRVGAEFGLWYGSKAFKGDLGPFTGLIGYNLRVRIFNLTDLFAEGYQEGQMSVSEWWIRQLNSPHIIID